jgi:hypothetical protein
MELLTRRGSSCTFVIHLHTMRNGLREAARKKAMNTKRRQRRSWDLSHDLAQIAELLFGFGQVGPQLIG